MILTFNENVILVFVLEKNYVLVLKQKCGIYVKEKRVVRENFHTKFGESFVPASLFQLGKISIRQILF